MIKAGIVGFRGYSGAELIRLLSRHAQATPVLMEHRSESGDQPLPRGSNRPQTIAASAESAKSAGLHVVFLATPPEVSIDVVPSLLNAGIKVIDLLTPFVRGGKAGLFGGAGTSPTATPPAATGTTTN